MPLDFVTNSKTFKVGIWDIVEDESYFHQNYDYTQEEIAEIDLRTGQHRLQLLASRAILQGLNISESGFKIVKDDHGKPHIISVQGEISLTHSHEMAAAIFAKYALVGIDIQIETDRILKIAPKFINIPEFNFIGDAANKNSYYHIVWGAKESLYKAYGRRKVDFKKNLRIYPFDYNPLGAKIMGGIDMPDYQGNFDIYYQKIKNYYFVYCVEHVES